jgi:hypothetical protein
MKTRTILLVTALFLPAAGCFAAPAGTQKASSDKAVEAPKAVMTAFHKAYPKAEIKSVDTESQDGTTYYEIESMDGSTRRDILYKEDGTAYEIEESISGENLPAAVKKTIDAEFPGGELKKADKITRGDTTQFETLLENNEKGVEVVLDSSGKILSRKSAADEDQESEGDEPDED